MYRQKSAYELKNKGDFEKLPLADMKRMHMQFLEDDYAKAKSRGDNNFGNHEAEEIIVRKELNLIPGSELTQDAKSILANLRGIDFTNGLSEYRYGLNNLRAIQPNTSKPIVDPKTSMNASAGDPIVKVPEQTKLVDTLPTDKVEITDITTNKQTDTSKVESSSKDLSQNNSEIGSVANTSSTNNSSNTKSNIDSSEESIQGEVSAQTGGLVVKPRILTQTQTPLLADAAKNAATLSAAPAAQSLSSAPASATQSTTQSTTQTSSSSTILYIIIVIIIAAGICGVVWFVVNRKNKSASSSSSVEGF